MGYEVKQGNIFGRIGQGFGKGLAEQVPKEIDRSRLSSGLKKLGEQENLNPFQQFAQLSSIPGVTPQMIESGSQLLRQQGVTQALKDRADAENAPKPNPFIKEGSSQSGVTKEAPSLTTRKPIEETLKNYIPKSFDQLQERAGQLLQENPALYASNPEKAMAAAVQEDQSNQNINAAYQTRRGNEQDVQNKVQADLQNQRDALEAKLPGDIYSAIEDKAINAVRSKEDGGEGLTEQEAKKKYGKELNQVSRDYESVKSLGGLGLLQRTPSESKREIKTLQQSFKERGDLQNFADNLISETSMSPQKAYYLAYPVSDEKALNNAIMKLPKQKTHRSGKDKNTTKYVENLAKNLGKGSPLSVAQELESRNYDPDVWLNYLNANRKSLELSPRQIEELTKPRNTFPTLNETWLFSLSGLDNLVEQ